MSLLRSVVLLMVLGSLALLTVQNWSAPMQLVFLGMRSLALPLPIWIVGALVAGILTTIVISILFRLTGFTAGRSARRPSPSYVAPTEPPPSSSYSYTPPSYTQSVESPRTTWRTATPPSTPSDPSSGDREEWGSEDASDWFDDSSDWADEPRDSRSSSRRTDYEVRQEPKSGSRSGSNYSYSYRDPDPPTNPADVVDADYRVIIPPNRNLEDDDFDDSTESDNHR
ncbi:LapA family protein [Myxacorys almedinensis]|uniref:LapA family protein n=1 Tax=Myxacorys almedinensis A TaxID=2690445 RepID=A0A8J7Z1X6_9CYAN|nr:LapA family protein [Myxacorys almedinensis]NDJ16666.1 LapA family protein [Myxacorys almedinensis A]